MLDRPTLEQLAAALLPEHRPYVVTSSEQPTGAKAITRECLGVAGPNVDVAFASWLREQGRWQGRRPGVFIDDLTILDEWRQRLLGVMVHELGHVEDCLPKDLAEPTGATTALAILSAELCDLNAGAYKIPRWYGHDAAWVRRCLHLRWRLEQAGHRIEPRFIYEDQFYELPPCDAFDSPLGGVMEYERLAHVPIGKLDDYMPAYLFRKLWHDWLDWWEEQNPELTPKVRGIVDRARAIYPRRLLPYEADWQ